jgi:hypothetical protein
MAAGEGCEWLESINGQGGNVNESSWSLQQAIQEWADRCRLLSAALDAHSACVYRENYRAARLSSRGRGHSTLRGPAVTRAA